MNLKVRQCLSCHKSFKVKSWSKRKYCPACHKLIGKENVKQLKEGKGKYFLRWKEGLSRFSTKLNQVVDNSKEE